MESEPRNLQADGDRRAARTLSMRWRVVTVGETVALEAKWVVDEVAESEITDRNVYATQADRVGDRLEVLDGDAPEDPERSADTNCQINVDERCSEGGEI
jgi:hypothetical protein